MKGSGDIPVAESRRAEPDFLGKGVRLRGILYRTTLKAGHGEPRRRPFALVQLQRSYGLQPRVARLRWFWEGGRKVAAQ